MLPNGVHGAYGRPRCQKGLLHCDFIAKCEAFWGSRKQRRAAAAHQCDHQIIRREPGDCRNKPLGSRKSGLIGHRMGRFEHFY